LPAAIGGNIAENAGGVHCLKYGLTLHNVLKLRVALMNGEVIEIGNACPGRTPVTTCWP
jgi:glycolate oxidase